MHHDLFLRECFEIVGIFYFENASDLLKVLKIYVCSLVLFYNHIFVILHTLHVRSINSKSEVGKRFFSIVFAFDGLT